MASDILHIKDGYYFEIPKMLWLSNRQRPSDFPKWFVRLDADYQKWEADELIKGLQSIDSGVDVGSLKETWLAWQNAEIKGDRPHTAWPLDAYLEQQAQEAKSVAKEWAAINAPKATDSYSAYIVSNKRPAIDWFISLERSSEKLAKWDALKHKINSNEFLDKYLTEAPGREWSQDKIDQYNSTLHGKILIPQFFGTPRNAYEPESGFCISRYMIIELVVALLVLVMFSWLAKKVNTQKAPTGKRWNMLEGMVQWVRNDVAIPAMGEHDADKFMPFLWTMFFFILGCNLMGMLPWVGSPTAAFGTTLALAGFVFVIGVTMGIKTFGPIGFLKNICPDLGLPMYLAIFIVPLLWVIEAFSLLIKHMVLAVRLLMNMGAGHLVLLGILGIGISVPAAMLSFPQWAGIATISVLGTLALSVLELFVACLQAYLFTFLAAMFIGSSMHHH